MLNKHEKQETMENVYKVGVEFKTVFNLVENEKKSEKRTKYQTTTRNERNRAT